MTFNSRFKLIFGEIFQSEGFKYCSQLNAFVKMLNEDLLAFIGVKSAPAWNKGSKGFFLPQELFLPIILLLIKILYHVLDMI